MNGTTRRGISSPRPFSSSKMFHDFFKNYTKRIVSRHVDSTSLSTFGKVNFFFFFFCFLSLSLSFNSNSILPNLSFPSSFELLSTLTSVVPLVRLKWKSLLREYEAFCVHRVQIFFLFFSVSVVCVQIYTFLSFFYFDMYRQAREICSRNIFEIIIFE